MFRLVLVALAVLAAAGCTGDDAGSGGSMMGTSPSTTGATTATAPEAATPTDTTFAADHPVQLCADLRALADIDPEVDPTQAQVDRLRRVAATAPPGVAEPLTTVADFGQAIVDGDPGGAAMEEAASGAALLLVAYGNDACGGIVIPLFNRLSGYS